MSISSETMHASCVAIQNRAVLIEGQSGSGKSDLALRLIDRGARLVSDDYTIVRRSGDRALASPGPNIEGMIEARGVGLIRMLQQNDVAIALIVALNGEIERLPDSLATRTIAGVKIPVLPINGFEASAPYKIELALREMA